MMFPLGLSIWRRHTKLTSFFWAANGITSMTASVFGMALSIEIGIARTYALGACLLPGLRDHHRREPQDQFCSGRRRPAGHEPGAGPRSGGGSLRASRRHASRAAHGREVRASAATPDAARSIDQPSRSRSAARSGPRDGRALIDGFLNVPVDFGAWQRRLLGAWVRSPTSPPQPADERVRRHHRCCAGHLRAVARIVVAHRGL